MNRIFRVELAKAFFSRQFIISLAIGLVLSVLCAVYHIQKLEMETASYERTVAITGRGMNPETAAMSLYNNWLNEDYTSLLASLYFMIFPLLSALAYGWSFIGERKVGYIKNVITRCNKRDYYLAKYTVTFLAGGTAVTVPSIVNFLITAMFFPALTPDIYYDISYAVRGPSLFSGLFYSAPLIYVLMRLATNFLFGGALAILSFTLAFFLRNRLAVLVLPFLSCLAVGYGQYLLPGAEARGELSPIYIVTALGHSIDTPGPAAAELLIMIGGSLTICILKGKREDVF